MPHDIYLHKATKTWFCILPVGNSKDADSDTRYWMQFKMDKAKKKITWQRLVGIPDEVKTVDWLYYDQLRDCLVGFDKDRCVGGKEVDEQEEEEESGDREEKYVLTYVADMSKLLWVSNEEDEKEEAGDLPTMQRGVAGQSVKSNRARDKKEKEKVAEPKSVPATIKESNIKPSKARRSSKSSKNVKNVKGKKGKEKEKEVKKVKSKGGGKGGKAGKEKEKKGKVVKREKSTKVVKEKGKGKGKGKEKKGKKASKGKVSEKEESAVVEVEVEKEKEKEVEVEAKPYVPDIDEEEDVMD